MNFIPIPITSSSRARTGRRALVKRMKFRQTEDLGNGAISGMTSFDIASQRQPEMMITIYMYIYIYNKMLHVIVYKKHR